MTHGDDPSEFVQRMRERVILFPEESKKLEFFRSQLKQGGSIVKAFINIDYPIN